MKAKLREVVDAVLTIQQFCTYQENEGSCDGCEQPFKDFCQSFMGAIPPSDWYTADIDEGVE